MLFKPQGAVAEYVAGLFNGSIVLHDEQFVLGAGITQILANDPERVFLYFVNLSTSDLFVSPFGQPSPSNGVLLGSNGGSISLDVKTDFQMCSHQWSVYSPAAAGNAFVLFGKRETKYEAVG